MQHYDILAPVDRVPRAGVGVELEDGSLVLVDPRGTPGGDGAVVAVGLVSGAHPRRRGVRLLRAVNGEPSARGMPSGILAPSGTSGC